MVNPRMGFVCELPAADDEILEVLKQNAKGLLSSTCMSVWSGLLCMKYELNYDDGISLMELLFG